ncbi:MAG: TRAP transporter small permease subunit [Hoeflea sp.]|uniref:TRAP transporter small permease n=1 Tax=Hoeflea sp. TaxID=1940281 RepID=UPI00329758EA
MIGNALETFCQGLRILIGLLMAVLAIPVGMQVISRYTDLIPTFLWTEELSTFIFVWIVMIGSMVAVWERTHFDVHVMPDASTPLATLLQNGTVQVLIIIFAVLFAWYGIEYARFGYIQNSVMMRANLLVTYISVPISGLIWALFASYRLHESITQYRHAREAQP